MNITVTSLSMHQDSRGWLVENEVAQARVSMKHFLVSTSKPGAIRGQHYHKRKREWFLVIQGEGRILFRDTNSGEESSVDVSGNKPQMVEIPPLVAHAIANTGREDLVVLGIVNEPLDRNDPDTYPFAVIR